jgi:hypothetical protein
VEETGGFLTSGMLKVCFITETAKLTGQKSLIEKLCPLPAILRSSHSDSEKVFRMPLWGN